MAISRLNLVSINFDKYRYNEVLLKLFSHDDFHPELASKFIDSVTGLSVYNQDNLYEEILVRLNDASNKYHFKLEEVPVETNQINVLRVKEYLDDLLLDVERIDAVKVQLDRMIIENQEAIIQLQHVADIDVDFDSEKRNLVTEYVTKKYGEKHAIGIKTNIHTSSQISNYLFRT